MKAGGTPADIALAPCKHGANAATVAPLCRWRAGRAAQLSFRAVRRSYERFTRRRSNVNDWGAERLMRRKFGCAGLIK